MTRDHILPTIIVAGILIGLGLIAVDDVRAMQEARRHREYDRRVMTCYLAASVALTVPMDTVLAARWHRVCSTDSLKVHP